MTHLREHWEGVSLSDDYTLEQWLGGDDSAAFFQTSIAPDGRRAVAKLIPETVAKGDAPLDLWHRTRQLRHPNLVELLDCGRAQHGGETVLYAVFESPDDTLASALSRSPLNELESREVLDSVIDALRYLHAQGLVLGALDPDHIVAIGDRIKVSTGALREADTSSAYREDVRLLGDLWREALMPASPQSAEIAAHAADPNPKSRWTLAEIGAALGAPLPAEPLPAPPVAVSPPIPEPLVEILPDHPVPPVAVRVRKVDLQRGGAEGRRETRRSNLESAALPSPHRRTPEHATSSRFPKWVFVGAAAVLLFILFLILNRSHSSGVAAKTRVAAVSPPVENLVPAPLPKIAAPKASVPLAPKRSMDAGQDVWRVIAFTYRTREAAVKKAQQLNEYHPGLNANMFLPKERGYYLVSLGGRMTHEEAERLQRSARGKGLPRDLYVQNYSR